MAKSELPKLFAAKQAELTAEVNNFKYATESDSLGDYSEQGFLMQILLILMED